MPIYGQGPGGQLFTARNGENPGHKGIPVNRADADKISAQLVILIGAARHQKK